MTSNCHLLSLSSSLCLLTTSELNLELSEEWLEELKAHLFFALASARRILSAKGMNLRSSLAILDYAGVFPLIGRVNNFRSSKSKSSIVREGGSSYHLSGLLGPYLIDIHESGSCLRFVAASFPLFVGFGHSGSTRMSPHALRFARCIIIYIMGASCNSAVLPAYCLMRPCESFLGGSHNL